MPLVRGRQRAKACISLAGYVLALAAAGLFHNHAPHGHPHVHAPVSPAGESNRDAAACAEPSAAHAHCSHGHVHQHATARNADRSATPRRDSAADGHGPSHGSSHEDHPPHEHDDCPVCQFLALKQLAASVPVVIAGCEPVAEAAELLEATLPHPLPWRPLSRAPPA